MAVKNHLHSSSGVREVVSGTDRILSCKEKLALAGRTKEFNRQSGQHGQRSVSEANKGEMSAYKEPLNYIVKVEA
jgi:hypothetical protein